MSIVIPILIETIKKNRTRLKMDMVIVYMGGEGGGGEFQIIVASSSDDP